MRNPSEAIFGPQLLIQWVDFKQIRIVSTPIQALLDIQCMTVAVASPFVPSVNNSWLGQISLRSNAASKTSKSIGFYSAFSMDYRSRHRPGKDPGVLQQP